MFAKMKNAGGIAAGAMIMIAVIAIPIALLMGAAEVSLWALKWIPGVTGIATFACIVLVPFAVIPATRRLASNLYGWASLAFAACLWLYALAFTYAKWGLLGVVIGVAMAGIGVALTGVLAAVFSAAWVVLGNMVWLFVLMMIASALSTWLAESADRRKMAKEMRSSPGRATLIQE